MPIANCIVTPDCQQESSNLIDLWSIESGQPSKHMTVNIITSQEQLGSRYNVMAHLILPSLWSDTEISSLQIGLAKALAQHFTLDLSNIHVITTVASSGTVVESGKELKW